MSHPGTMGWFTCETLSKRRMGVPGPDDTSPLDGSPFYVAVKIRTHGRHEGHRSYWEWDDKQASWMLLVLDEHRNIVGQAIGRTQEACHRKMNTIYAAKGLGVYNGEYAPGGAKDKKGEGPRIATEPDVAPRVTAGEPGPRVTTR